MATTTKTQTTVQDATVQAQDIAERLLDASKKAAGEYLNVTEKATQSLVTVQRQVAAQTDVEWVASLITANAQLTGDISKVVVSTGRELLK
jgi:DNA-binding ferritin-like protein